MGKRLTELVFVAVFGVSFVALIHALTLGDWFKISMAFVALGLYFVPWLAKKFLKIELMAGVEVVYFLFIFAALILGEVFAFYGPFLWWDVVLHFLAGLVLAGLGYSLMEIMAKGKQARGLLLLFAFCFSTTAGILWECTEFSFDMLVRTDAQKDAHVRQISTITLQRDGGNQPVRINDIERTEIYVVDGETVTIDEGFLDIGLMDTMKDILVNFAGAGAFVIIGMMATKNKLKFVHKV